MEKMSEERARFDSLKMLQADFPDWSHKSDVCATQESCDISERLRGCHSMEIESRTQVSVLLVD